MSSLISEVIDLTVKAKERSRLKTWNDSFLKIYASQNNATHFSLDYSVWKNFIQKNMRQVLASHTINIQCLSYLCNIKK